MTRIIGIDLGTTNTCTAFVSNKIPRVIPTESGFNTMPSVVTLHPDGSVLVGQAAKEQMLTNPERTLHGIKRLLGRQLSSKTVQELRDYFSYTLVAGEDGEAAIEVGGQRHSCAELQSHVLRQIKRYAEINLGDEIPDVVIAVPAYYNDHQRMLVKKAGSLAGWNVERLVNEPTAAALAYGFNRGFDQKILIYDLGGGTFDISILEVTSNVFEVVATGGDVFLGGADFDARVQDWILERLREQTKIDLSDEPAALQRVRGAAERAKIELSLLANTEIRLPGLLERRGKAIDFEVMLDRETLNALTRDLVERTITVIDELLAASGIDKQAIDEVIPVGGQTRMPLVVDAITAHFGKSPRKGIHPDECVALGAALLGDSLAKIDAVTLLDTLSVPIGVPDPNGMLQVLIDKNVRLPHKASVQIATSAANQTTLELDVFQGEANVPVQTAEYLGTLRVEEIPAAPAGEVNVQVQMSLDGEGMLTITAGHDRGGSPREVKLTTVERPPAAESLVEERRRPGVVEPEPETPTGLKGLMRNLLKKK
jgi:molecular chaperone DnaK